MVLRFCFCLLLTIFFSCKKEKIHNDSPVISILQPLKNQSFNALDTIYVQGLVEDNEGVIKVDVSLRNSNNIRVLSGIVKNVNSTVYNLNEQFVLNDVHLPSGFYHLKISAYDQVNQTDIYIPLQINALPTLRNGLFVFSNSGSTNQVSLLSNSLVATSFTVSSGDFLGGLVNSYHQKVVISPSVNGNFRSHDIITKTENWGLINTASGLPNFSGLAKNENEIFVAFYNGNIRSYVNNSSPKFSGSSFLNSYARKMYVHENNLLLTEQPEIFGGKIRLVSYYLASGAIKDNVELNEDVVSMFGFSTNEMVIFSNALGTGKIKIYNTSLNSTWQPFALSPGIISSVAEISKGIYLITQNGEIKKVNVNNFSQAIFLTGVNANMVKYDAVNNEVIAISGNSLTMYDFGTKNIKGTYLHPIAILALDFWYNK